MNSKKKVIIDCDPGIDDSLALMLALDSPELDILGITTVCGNVPVEFGSQNALKVLELMGIDDISVYSGAEKPWRKPLVTAQDTHGMDGLGETDYEVMNPNTVKDDAVSWIIKTLKENQDISIIALGPLTNIADALKRSPEAFEHLERFVSMGGNYKSHGNCSPVAEFNYWVDPDAARYVYEHMPVKIEMVGLDVTRKIVLTPDLLSLIGRFDNRKSWFVTDITRFYVDFHWQQERVIGCVINDPLAVAYFIDPSICKGFDSYTTIETEGLCLGQSIIDDHDFWKQENNSHILTETSVKTFMNMFLKRLFMGYEDIIEEQLNKIYITE